MTFVVSGLPVEPFQPLFGLSDGELAERGVIRRIADSKPGYPCRITLEDAEPGETVLLLNFESHRAATPYRSSFAIFVRQGATEPRVLRDDLPPAMFGRPVSLRIFDGQGMLLGADMGRGREDLCRRIEAAFAGRDAAYIHAHNSMHGCFIAEIRRDPDA
jgi:hypothetical protein